MNRRSFLATLAAGFVADPEKLLWRPGAKTISIPRTSPSSAIEAVYFPELVGVKDFTFKMTPEMVLMARDIASKQYKIMALDMFKRGMLDGPSMLHIIQTPYPWDQAKVIG